jgi:LCP family protein required for cell wall assembly
MDFDNKKQKQMDIRRFNYSYGSDTVRKRHEVVSRNSQEKLPKKVRKWPKRLFILLLILLIASVIVLAVGYLLIDRTRLKGEEEGRVNIVVSGVDEAAKLSDTLMIVSLDTKHEELVDYKAAIVSVPRDLYVQIPPFGGNKINAAYSLGENPNNEINGGGLALVRTTVEKTFDVDVHYQAAVDFKAFEDIVDAVGGVTIDVPKDIYDPYYPTTSGGQQVVQFEAGKQKMDGAEALKYARSRQTTSDFDRAARQQQVMLAVKEKVFSADFALDQSKIRSMYDALKENIETDMSFPEMLRLAEIGQSMPDKNITRHVLDNEEDNLLVATNLYGYTLSPKTGNFTEIQEFIDDIFTQRENTLPKTHEKE